MSPVRPFSQQPRSCRWPRWPPDAHRTLRHQLPSPPLRRPSRPRFPSWPSSRPLSRQFASPDRSSPMNTMRSAPKWPAGSPRPGRTRNASVPVRCSCGFPAPSGTSCRRLWASAGQIERGWVWHAPQHFDPKRVPDVMNAQASLDWAKRIRRIRRCSIRKWCRRRVRSAPDAGRSRSTAVPGRTVNAAEQSIRLLEAARAVSRSRTNPWRTPRCGRRSRDSSPSGGQRRRLRDQGHARRYRRRIDPLRVELTVPEQAVALVKIGQPVRATVDAYPGEEFVATVRFVSPALRVDQRALTVEAVAPMKTDG